MVPGAGRRRGADHREGCDLKSGPFEGHSAATVQVSPDLSIRPESNGKWSDMTEKQPAPPKGTRSGGKKLWCDVLGKYELEQHEIALLREAVRTVDDLDALADVVAAEGVTIGYRVHPALVEARQLRISLARLVGALRLPAGDEDDQPAGRRPQRRGGARGVYARGGAS